MKRTVLAILVVVALLAASMGAATAVTDGVPDGDHHPFVGWVINLDFTSACTGSAISPDLFITAAHCFFSPGEPVVVTFESDLATAPMESFHLGYWFPNPDFDITTAEHDTAIVVFEDSVQLPRYAVLPSEGFVDTLRNHHAVDLVGYGAIDFPLGGPHLPEFGSLRLMAESKLLSPQNPHGDWIVRVMAIPGHGHGEGTGGYCFGDSGAPVLLAGTDVILGIHSFGPNCRAWTAGIRIDTAEEIAFIGGFLN